MITNNELNAITVSATKKDFYQIWNELLDLAGKISERWDPTSTNESDPGIVLLKVLTAMGDKLNYTIDSNALEAFMPSAAQMESMRKLCDMMGYNIKYYQSAVTDVKFAFVGDESHFPEIGQVLIPMFTVVKNEDSDVSYVTIEDKIISKDLPVQTIKCMEGQAVRCESINNNIVTINQIDDNYRYYLPENQIAENGIFIYRINDGLRSNRWEKVENLNTQSYGSLVYKFGFDSKEQRPYIQFPDDIGQIIEDGLEIFYIRTSGLSGNISARTLSTFEKPENEFWKELTTEDFDISNASAATNGANIETITQAYNNFKKTVGTFDTLVTCRDYMNAIYNLINDSNIPTVSNIIVSDIRDDINKSVTLCSFNDYGINYINKSVKSDKIKILHDYNDPFKTINYQEDAIDNFDLILYPFKTVQGLNTKSEFDNSFKYNESIINHHEIESSIEDLKTISHKIKYPMPEDVVCIKNYLKLNATITTTTKVNLIEEASIIESIKALIFKNFNARQLDFGEEIPFESILACIENADQRIKNVVLDEPTLYTKFTLANGKEYDTASFVVTERSDGKLEGRYPGRELYNKLVLRNILAGRLELFNYNKNFKYDLTEKNYNYNLVKLPDGGTKNEEALAEIYPNGEQKIVKLIPECSFDTLENIKLTNNELIRFRAPSFATKVTYPAYVNYYLYLENTDGFNDKPAIPATFIDLSTYMQHDIDKWGALNTIIKAQNNKKLYKEVTSLINSQQTYDTIYEKHGMLFIISNSSIVADAQKVYVPNTRYYIIPLNSKTFVYWHKFIVDQPALEIGEEKTPTKLNGIYRYLEADLSRPFGYEVDVNHVKYKKCNVWLPVEEDTALLNYFVQQLHIDGTNIDLSDPTQSYTGDGLGQTAVYTGIPKLSEYKLRGNDYLAINYTAQKAEGQTTGEVINKLYTAKDGTIIRPNFDLLTSSKAALTKRYAKTSGYSFKGKSQVLTSELPGMFSLSTNEQIEIVDEVKVELTDTTTYLYWILNEDRYNFERKVFEESLLPDSDVQFKYTLEDGEYLFYTDINKTDMAYYGTGSEITFFNNVKLEKSSKDKLVSVEEIMENGIAAIPWIKYSFSADQGKPKIVIREYQYINLVKDDEIVKLFPNGAMNKISNKWQAVDGCNYIIGGVPSSLPSLNIGTDNTNWEVKSILMLDTSPTISQVLGEHDKITLIYDNDEKQEIAPRYNNELDPKIVQLSIKTNYPCQSTSDSVNVTTYKINEYNEKEYTNDFKIKLYEDMPVGAVNDNGSIDATAFKLHDFSSELTAVPFERLNSKQDHIKLNLNVPKDSFGLIMVNYSGEKSASGAYVRAVSTKEGIPENLKPVIYNYKLTPDSSETWWEGDYTDSNVSPARYKLRKGINLIKIEKACDFMIYADTPKLETIIFSDLKIVPKNNSLNMRAIDYQKSSTELYNVAHIGYDEVPEENKYYICYKSGTLPENRIYTRKVGKKDGFNSFTSGYEWFEVEEDSIKYSESEILLNDINKVDTEHEFYYSCPMDNSTALDLNTKLIGTSDEVSLQDPWIWYDYNNVNNKFVISEIDSNYLDFGIKIARTSKR